MINHTKANSLKIINTFNKKLVPKFIYFEKQTFTNNKSKIVEKIKSKFNSDIIIRSSAKNEDSHLSSNAGHYDSFIVRKKNFCEIEKIISSLIKKFKNKNDEILIQKFIDKPDITGVLFTKDKDTNSNYYNLSYDKSKKTYLITSGINNPTIKSVTIYKHTKLLPKRFKKLIQTSLDFEKLFKNDRLDIEFIIKNNRLYILQCRPLLGIKKKVNSETLEKVKINLIKKFKKINIKNETLAGKKTILSNMSDWNPAEIIGKKPSNLSLSLYSELITNSIWAKQRYNYGYKDVRPNKLMLNIAGSPYIDLRVDFNSFLPSKLNKEISEKIIDYQINKINKKPYLHDKVEFEVINTCYDFNLEKRINKIPLTQSEKKIYTNELFELTNNILNQKNKFFKNEIIKIESLKKRIDLIKKSNLSHIQKIHYFINDCKNLGTLPFAGVARCAFISKSILDSLVYKKLLSKNDLEKFYLSINTVSKDINSEFIKAKKSKNFTEFFNNYGHLRPSTYSIIEKNYKDNLFGYFSKVESVQNNNGRKNKFILDKKKYLKINNLFKEKKISINFNQFLKFAKLSIENREYLKLIFSRSIDEIFSCLKDLAKEININYQEFQHLDIDLILKAFHNLEQENLKKTILRNININKRSASFSKYILLPDVINNVTNFEIFHDLDCKENYITNKSIVGEIFELNKSKKLKNTKDKIILIENADPGFDFIFSYKLKALVTKYGGSNSHMAIRCMELGLPAIIGVGDKIYNQLSKSKKVFIDCNNNKYSIIH
jgi:glutamine kinase